MIAWISQNYTLFTALSAVVATAAFVLSTLSNSKFKRADRIREWQRIIVAEIFQTNSEKVFSFSDILEKYHSAATEYNDHRLNAQELSKATLRRILVELVQSDVIEQMPHDCFRLDYFDRRTRDQAMIENLKMTQGGLMEGLGKMLGTGPDSILDPLISRMQSIANEEGVFDNKLRADAINFIGENPGRYTTIEVAALLSRDGSWSQKEVQATVLTLMAEGMIDFVTGEKIAIRNQTVVKAN